MMENVLIKLRLCSTKPRILSKNRAHVRAFCRSAENSNVFTKKPPRRRLLFSKVYSCNLIEKSSTTKIAVRYLCQAFFNEVVGIQSMGCNFIKNNVLLKNI